MENENAQLREQLRQMALENERLKSRIAELEAPPAGPRAMADAHMALRTVFAHTRDEAMAALMAKVKDMQVEVNEFRKTIDNAGLDFEITHVVNVLNELIASRGPGHTHRVDADGLQDTGIHTLGDWLSALIGNSELGEDGRVTVWENDLVFLSHPDMEVE